MKLNKTLWRISVTTTLEADDAVTDLLGTLLGQPASSHFNVETQTSLVSAFGAKKIILAGSFREQALDGLKRIKDCGLNIGPGKIKIAKVRREDWAESWKRHFKAIEIDKALLIKPSWIKRPARKNQQVVILDPGLSFGTGQHATTSFCLHQIVAACRVGAARQQSSRRLDATKSFLDIGTGSGILAIAAVKLGYKPVRAFDFDPECVRVASANARVNQVQGKLKITRDDATKLPLRPTQKYDLVCANLISNLLIAERRRIVAQVNRGGTLVLAGILKSEFSEVQSAFEDLGLKLFAAKNEKEWRSGSFRFRT
ncbi:MAG: 50S ribosomal protein L11 methyltransferase [Limisphaerales bacterium]